MSTNKDNTKPRFDASDYTDEEIKECQSYVIGESCEACGVYDFECPELLEDARQTLRERKARQG
jgi:hypothetical protein